MIGYYPYVIVTLLCIYPHSTNQTEFIYGLADTERQLLAETPGVLRSTINGVTTDAPVDLVCNELTQEEKKQMCEEAMRWVVRLQPQITGDTRKIRVDRFLEATPNISVPHLANPADPYTCNRLFVERVGIKNMFWCPNRVFSVKGRGATTDQLAGFFMSSSGTRADEVYIFKPRRADGDTLRAWAMMRSVPELKRAAQRCGVHSVVGSSSSAVTPLNE